MSFQNLPNEIILEIAGHLNSCRDKNAFLQVNGHVHLLLHDELYRNNIRRTMEAVWHGRQNATA